LRSPSIGTKLVPRFPLKKIEIAKENIWRTRVLSLDEETKLLEKAGPRLTPVIILAVNTGLRIGESPKITARAHQLLNPIHYRPGRKLEE